MDPLHVIALNRTKENKPGVLEAQSSFGPGFSVLSPSECPKYALRVLHSYLAFLCGLSDSAIPRSRCWFSRSGQKPTSHGEGRVGILPMCFAYIQTGC